MKTTSTEQSSNTNPITSSTYYGAIPSNSNSISIGSHTINTSNIWTSTGTYSGPSITVDYLEDIRSRLEKLEKIVGVLLEDPSPEKLEQHRALKDAYEKYKMIERLTLSEDSK